MKPAPPLLIVVSAPSGAGKTTLCQRLLGARPEIERAITCTTRKPRAGERDGVDYYFLDDRTFQARCSGGEFLEWATVFGNSYGTLRSEVLTILHNGKDALLSVDVQGAASIRRISETDPELSRALVTVFLTPVSMTVLESRLRKRALDAPEVIERRLTEARNEISRWREFDFVIVSGTVDQDFERMLTILDAEKLRTRRIEQPDFQA